MKAIYKICTLILVYLCLSNSQVNAQCGPAGFQYPSFAVTPTGIFTAVDPCSFAGDYFLINVIAGNSYTFSTCSADGSNITYDSQLSMWDEGSLSFIAYSDDACGLQSRINWTATFTGLVRMNLNLYYCGTNSTCGTVMMKNNTLGGYDPCASIPNISSCGTSVTSSFAGSAGAWSSYSGPFGTPGQEKIYTFTAPSTGTYTLNVSSQSADYYVDLFYKPVSSGCNNAGWTYTDDIYWGETGTIAATDMFLTGGVQYYIMLDDENTTANTITWSLNCPVIAGDICSSAFTLSCNTTVSGSTVGFTPDATPCNTWSSPGVWYQITPSSNSNITLSMCGSSYDTWISVYSGSCPSGFTCVTQNDDNCGLQSQVTFVGNGGTTYYVLVNGYSANAGSYILASTCTPTGSDPCTSPINIANCGDIQTVTLGSSGSWNTAFCGWSVSGEERVYSYTPTVTGNHRLQVTATSANDYCDFAWQAGTCGMFGWNCIQDIFNPGTYGNLAWNAGTTYYILIDKENYSSTSPVTFSFTITCPVAAPPNDDCSAAIPQPLAPGSPITFTGNTSGATSSTDGSFSAFPTVWHAFTISSCADVTLDYCATSPAFQDVWINLATACPAFSFTPAGSFAGCGNGNYTVTYYGLAAGTYWIPVLGEEPFYVTPGPYTLTVSATACAPAPPNDDCSAAVPVLLTTGVPVTFTGSTVGATAGTDGSFTAFPTVWEAFTITSCASVTISYCATSPAFMDIWINLATACPAFSFTPGGNFSGCGNGNYTITHNNLAAGTYWIPILGNEPGYVTPGPYSITVTAVDCPLPPVNDECTGALPLVCGTTVSGDNTAAQDDASIAATCGSAFSGQYKGVWYTFSIIFPSDVSLTTCNTGMPSWDTYLRVYSGNCGSLSCVNSNDDNCGSYAFHSTLNLPNLAPGTYYVMLSGYGSASFGAYNLSLACSSLVPPAIVSNSPVCEGNDIVVESPANGIAYQWSFNGVDITGATDHDYIVPSADPNTDGGLYSVLITTASATYSTDGIVVVNPAPEVSASAPLAFCEGTADLQLSSTAPTGTSWEWSGPNGFTSSDEDPLRSPSTFDMSGSYEVIVTDANGCSDSVTISATVYALPPVEVIVIGNVHLCTGQTTADLQATGAGVTGSYSWSTSETSDLITVTGAGTFTVTGTDLNSCVNTDQVVITESAPPADPIIVALGDINLCSSDGGGSYTSVVLHTVNYSTDLLWTSSEGTPDITVDYIDNFNVTYTDAVGCFAVSNTISTISNFASTSPLNSQVSSDAPGNVTCAVPVILTVAEADGTDPLADAYLGSGAQWVWYDEAGCGVNQIGTGASITYTPSAVPGPHTFYVRAEGFCNTTSCASIVITVKDPSVAPASASATVSTLCAGDQTTLIVTGGFLGTGAQWKWYSGSCGGSLVGLGNNVIVNTGSTTTYYVRAEGDCNTTLCESTTVTVRTLSTDPASASSNAPGNAICIGGSVTLSVAGGGLGDNSDWVWYEDGCGNGAPIGTGSSVIITPSYEGLHSYYVRAEGPCNTTNCVGVSVLVGSPSVEATSITPSVGGASICIGNNIDLTLNGGFLGTVAQWKWYTGSCGGTAAGTGTTITVNPLVTTTYYVRAEGSCNNTICRSIVVNVSNLPPTGSPPTITSAPNGICSGNAGTVTANPVAGATFYSWSAPSGTTFDGGNTSPYITTSNSVQVTFGNLPIGVSGYDICVFAGNGCGNSVTKCRYIRGRVQGAQTISGNASSCPNTSSLYSIVSLPGADSYTWTVTGAATINGGGTTLTTNSTSVTVNFLAGWTSGTLSVYGSMNCGYNGPTKTITIISTPVVPGIMTGPTLVCPNGTYSYSIAPVAGALSYNWSTNVPGATLAGTGTSRSITFPAVIPAGSTVSVTATGSCGTSLPRVKNIATGLANAPGTIQGPAMGQCGQTGVAYSILPVAGATSYFWSATNGAVINGPNNATVASVDFPVLFSTSNVSVVAVNSCGNSAPQTKLVSGAPGSPGAITGSNSVCIGTIQSYSVVGSAGATAYVWSSPVGSTIVGGQNSPTVQVYFDAVTSGNVSVYASNSCGSSPVVNFGVSVVCRLAQVSQGSLLDAMLYPNPTIGTTTLKFETATAGDYKISVIDITGQLMQTEKVTAIEGLNMHELDLSTYAKGLYMIRMEREGEAMQMLRVTVE